MSNSNPTRIMIVDDQSIILDGLAALLEGDKGFQVVGTAASGEQAMKLMPRLMPDVVVMDISMPPGMDGIEATERIKHHFPDCQVLMLSMYHKGDMVNDALEAGASGYVLKNTSRDQFRTALRAVAVGERYLAPEVVQDLEAWQDRSKGQVDAAAITLTRREKEIIRMVVRECTTQQIADALGLSFRTVEAHRRNIMIKLNIHNMAGMVKYAMDRGWNV